MTKKHKDIFIGIIIGSLIFSYIPAFAQNIIEVSLANYTIKINGTTVEPENQPLLYQDRTYVPLRFIAEALDKDVGFEDGIIEINDKVIENQQIQQQSQKITQKEDNQTQNIKSQGVKVIYQGEEMYFKGTNIPEDTKINAIRWVGFKCNDDIYINEESLDKDLWISISSPLKNIIEFKNTSIDSKMEYIRYTKDDLSLFENAITGSMGTYYNLKLFNSIVMSEEYNKLVNYPHL